MALRLASPVDAGAQTNLCATSGPRHDQIAGVEARLALRLASGALLRLVGADPADMTPTAPDRDEATRAALAQLIGGRQISWLPLADSADRWGRWPAYVFLRAQPGGLAADAIARGWARYLAEPAAHACRAEFLAEEIQARRAALGLWADPYYSVLAVDDRAAFAERSATIILAEGRVAVIEPSPYRTVLRFTEPGATKLTARGDTADPSRPSRRGSFGGHMLVATIRPRLVKTFEAQGMKLSSLLGETIRMRGLLDTRFGPRVALDGPDSIELVPSAQIPAPAPPAPTAPSR
jgi:hypothetical protein